MRLDVSENKNLATEGTEITEGQMRFDLLAL
jgi:hypothetical protein